MPEAPQDSEAVLAVLRDIRTELAEIHRALASVSDAFPHNDLGKPDFDGHRQDHLKRMAEARTMQDYKHGVTKQIISMTVVFVTGLLASGLVNALVERVSK